AGPGATAGPKERDPKPAATAEKPRAAPEAAPPPTPAPAPQPQAAPATQDGDGAAITDDVRASPLARRLAAELGVNLATIKGTGPEGRIVKEDVQAAASGKTAPARAASAPVQRPSGPDVEIVEPTRM